MLKNTEYFFISFSICANFVFAHTHIKHLIYDYFETLRSPILRQIDKIKSHKYFRHIPFVFLELLTLFF